MIADVALGALGGVGKFALYFKKAAQTKESNISAIGKFIKENNLFIQYILQIEIAIKTRAGEGQLSSYPAALQFLEKSKAFLDSYHGDKSKLLNANDFDKKIKELLAEMKELREKLYQDLDLFYKNNPPVQVPLPVVAPSLPEVEPAASAPGYATMYLYKNHPVLAKLRDEYKHFNIVPSDPLYQIGISLLEDKDYEQAIIWLKRANTPKAHFNLGRIYRKGDELGVKKDLDVAKAYYEQACEQTTDFEVAARAALDLGTVLADPEYSEPDIQGARDIWTTLSQDLKVREELMNIAEAAIQNLAILEKKHASSSGPSTKQ